MFAYRVNRQAHGQRQNHLHRLDASIAEIAARTAKDISALRQQAFNDTSFLINLRHDINTLAAALNQLRADVDQLKQTVPKANA